MIDYHTQSRRVEVLGEGTQAQRREALVARLKRELQERFNYLPTRTRIVGVRHIGRGGENDRSRR